MQTNRSPVLKNYKLLAAFEGQRDVLPHSPECDCQFCSKNREPRLPLLRETTLGTHVAQAPLDKKGRGKLIGSGSAAEVGRRFGGGTFHLSKGGSFGGTGSPKTVESKKAGLLIRGLTEARGSLAGLISSPKAFSRGAEIQITKRA